MKIIDTLMRRFNKNKKRNKIRDSTYLTKHIEHRTFKRRKKNHFKKVTKVPALLKQNFTRKLLLAILGLLIFGFTIFLSSSYFNIPVSGGINISRTSPYINIKLANEAVENYRGKKIYTIDTKVITENIMSYQNGISSVDISLNIPNTIDITLYSFKPIFRTSIAGKLYDILENGTLVPVSDLGELDSTPSPLMVYSSTLDSDVIIPYKIKFEQAVINKILTAIKLININLGEIEINGIHYFLEEEELILEINNNTEIIIDLKKDIDESIKQLTVFDTEEVQIASSGLVYIDNRIKNKVYICRIENKATCDDNITRLYGSLKEMPISNTIQE